MNRVRRGLQWFLLLVAFCPFHPLWSEDGYELWLRYPPLENEVLPSVDPLARSVVSTQAASAIVNAAIRELQDGLSALLGRPVPVRKELEDGSILVGTISETSRLASLNLAGDTLGPEGFLLRSEEIDGSKVTVLAANTDLGLLYGAFALLRMAASGAGLADLHVSSSPAVKLRLLNHWDNLDGTVERGYAGGSIWDWWRLPDIVDRRYLDYARANASIGINGAVLNNVNAAPEILTPRYIAKAAAVAEILRPYGIRVFLSVRFSSPVEIGGLSTADPLDPQVRAWWLAKAREIYRAIPDFGGFLVKANSESQPGPQDYGRSHAEGANLLAEALEPHGGVVMWRAFVYSEVDPEDRVKQAYSEFKPLDGSFAGNVLVQVKNGPLDFQPREPFHPLFGQMPATPLMMEFQITQEYLGFSTHLVYLGTLWEEALDAETYMGSSGSTVASVVDGSLHGHTLTGVAGVSNIGSARDWTGAPFAQANWYAFGRLAWQPNLSAREIAQEWLRLTFTADPEFVAAATEMMMRSREAAVDYMTPLGLAHLMGTGHHYGPAPWVDDLPRPEWNPYYYHRADSEAIGFDRTATGSNAVAQYAPLLAEQFSDIARVPEQYLLWFHRLPWGHRMRSGATLWEALVAHYDRGVAEVHAMQQTWSGLATWVDEERFHKTSDLLRVQAREARWWRDACLAYFSSVSGRALPQGVRPPDESLEYYRSLKFPYAPGN